MSEESWARFEDYRLQTEILNLWRQKKSGTLYTETETCKANLFFDKGDIRYAVTNRRDRNLGKILVDQQVLTQEQYQGALGNFKKGWSIGKNLLSIGLITRPELVAALEARVYAIFADCLHARSGSFRWERVSTPKKTPMVSLSLPQDLIKAILEWEDKAWISAQFPDNLDFVVTVDFASPINFKEVRVADFALPVYRLIDGQRNFRRLAFEVDIDDFLLLKFLYALMLLGCIKVRRVSREEDTTIPEHPEMIADYLGDASEWRGDFEHPPPSAADEPAKSRTGAGPGRPGPEQPPLVERAKHSSGDLRPVFSVKSASTVPHKRTMEPEERDPDDLLEIDDQTLDLDDRTDVFSELVVEPRPAIRSFNGSLSSAPTESTLEPLDESETSGSDEADAEALDAGFDRIIENVSRKNGNNEPEAPAPTPRAEGPSPGLDAWDDPPLPRLDSSETLGDTAPAFSEESTEVPPPETETDPVELPAEWFEAPAHSGETDTETLAEFDENATLPAEPRPAHRRAPTSAPPNVIMPDRKRSEDFQTAHLPKRTGRWRVWSGAAVLLAVLGFAGLWIFDRTILLPVLEMIEAPFSSKGPESSPQDAEASKNRARPKAEKPEPEKLTEIDPPAVETASVPGENPAETDADPPLPEKTGEPPENRPSNLAASGKFQEAAERWRSELIDREAAFTLGIFMICDPENVRKTVENALFDPRFFMLPRNFGGRDCFWVCWGRFSSETEAANAVGDLPEALVEEGNDVKVYAVSTLIQ